ncbi:MAG: phosphopantetheine-binding protein [Melioribacteraceae bacterium]|nr:phosphopantetheine-binding protein [Melioribacteraceae bacterium]
MDHEEVTKKVKNCISTVLEIDSNTISNDSNFIFDLGADSMQSITLVAAFEEEFEIELDEDKALEVQTVSDAVEFIKTYL